MINNTSIPDASLPVSALLLCHRHDERLAAALTSVQWAQQILVLDTKPDSTVPWENYISLYPHLRVVRPQSFELNFSAWRNHLLEYVTQPWVFYIDSDEVAEIIDYTKFKDMLSQLTHSFAIRRIDYLFSKRINYGEVGNVWLTRLGPHLDMKFTRTVHETNSTVGQRTDVLILHHYSHQSIKDFIEKVVLYSALEGQTRNKNATDAIILIQAVLFPCVKFLYTYFLLCGYVDGWRGLIYAVNMSLHSLLVRIFWYENKHKHA
jgi:hypothetical protein